MQCAAIVLAAGSSSRLGEAKQLLRNELGETLVHRAAREASEAGAQPVCVVVGAQGASVRAAVQDLDVLVVENANWNSGMASSIQAGVAAVRKAGELLHIDIDAVLILACDMPTVGSLHMQALMQALTGGAARAASAYGTTIGIPAVFPNGEFAALQLLTGDHGAKQLLLRADTVTVPLERGTFDLDTPADIAEWRRTRPGQEADRSEF